MGGVSKMTIYADVGWMGGSEKAQKIWSLMRCTEYTHSDSDSIMGFADCTVGPLLTYIATGLANCLGCRGCLGAMVFLGLRAWHPWVLGDHLTLFKPGGHIIPTTLLLGTHGSKIPTQALS